jgi:pilus assembly protein Flp/PilA
MRAHDERGASSVEYGLLAALVAGAIIGTVLTFGPAVHGSYQDSCTKITTAMGSDCTP